MHRHEVRDTLAVESPTDIRPPSSANSSNTAPSRGREEPNPPAEAAGFRHCTLRARCTSVVTQSHHAREGHGLHVQFGQMAVDTIAVVWCPQCEVPVCTSESTRCAASRASVTPRNPERRGRRLAQFAKNTEASANYAAATVNHVTDAAKPQFTGLRCWVIAPGRKVLDTRSARLNPWQTHTSGCASAAPREPAVRESS